MSDSELNPPVDELVSIKNLALVPEVPLYLGDSIKGLWQRLTNDSTKPPPYWAFAWAGGQALARYTLDNPEIVRGKRVLDVGSGSGINAIPAMIAGATVVDVLDNEPYALALSSMNADGLHNKTNYRLLEQLGIGWLDDYDVIIMGDGFYDPEMTLDVLSLFDQAIAGGVPVYVGDIKREYFPERRAIKLGDYMVSDTMDLERRPVTPAFVYQLTEN